MCAPVATTSADESGSPVNTSTNQFDSCRAARVRSTAASTFASSFIDIVVDDRITAGNRNGPVSQP
jgi:hypothetical protein